MIVLGAMCNRMTQKVVDGFERNVQGRRDLILRIQATLKVSLGRIFDPYID